jgi:hypothetical protein
MDINDKKNLILTTKNRQYLAGDFDPAGASRSRSNPGNHDRRIQENTRLAVFDLAHLFRHAEDRHFTRFAEGWEPKDDDLVDTAQPELIGFVSDGVVGREGTPHEGEQLDPDDEINPETRSAIAAKLEQQAKRDKAKPDTQRALVDAVAFLCRAAEAGGLDVHEVLERGVERYYRGHPKKDSHIINLQYWNEEKDAGKIKADFQEGPGTYETPRQMGDGRERHLAREGYDINPGDDENDIDPDKATVKDGTIICGEAPVEIDDSMVEAVTETLLDIDMGALADRLAQENDHIDAPVLAKTVREFVLYRTNVEELADHAEVSPDVLQRVLTRHADEIESSLAAEYDNIENHVDVLSGWAVDTDDE